MCHQQPFPSGQPVTTRLRQAIMRPVKSGSHLTRPSAARQVVYRPILGGYAIICKPLAKCTDRPRALIRSISPPQIAIHA